MLYESVLRMIVKLIETINQDGLGFGFKGEYQRIYNLLMAVIVNDQEKSQQVSQLLAQSFNRLSESPVDELFIELGVPEEWSSSRLATQVTADIFKEQQDLFHQSDEGLRWQWFTDLETLEFTNFDQTATGVFLTRIDLHTHKKLMID